MMMAAAKALASVSPTLQDPAAPLLPAIADSRGVAMVVAEAVGRQAISDGISDLDPSALTKQLQAYVWEPVYHPYERVKPPC
jgi:malate dehydrogenase (oxaloacetate-decarboxylating)